MRHFYNLVFIFFLLTSLKVYSQESFKKGQTLLIPINLGFDQSILGSVFDEEMKEINSNSIKYPTKIFNENVYQSKFQTLDTESIYSLAVNALGFVKGGISNKRNINSGILTAYKIRKIEQIEFPEINEGLLIASSLYYGWSVNYYLESAKSELTQEIGLELKDLVTSNSISFQNKLKELGINQEISTRGLEQAGVVTNLEELNENFNEGQPVPIFLELTFLRDYNPNALDWDIIIAENKEIAIEEIWFSVSEMKNSSQRWDNTSHPDPILEIYLGDELVMTTDKINDSLNPIFSIDASIKFSELANLTFVLYDYDDFTGNDLIGQSVIPIEYLKSGNTNNEIELIFNGQILQSIIKFYSLEE